MAELPNVIPSALVNVINTFEGDDIHQFGICIFVCEMHSSRQKCHS